MFLPFFSCFSQPFAYGTAVLPLRSCEETSEPSVPPVTRHPHTSPGRHWDSCHLRIVSAGSWINRNQVAKKYIPSLKLTARTWKWMVGILLSYWEGLFSRAMLVSGRVYPKALGPLPVTWQSCVKIQYLYIISIYMQTIIGPFPFSCNLHRLLSRLGAAKIRQAQPLQLLLSHPNPALVERVCEFMRASWCFTMCRVLWPPMKHKKTSRHYTPQIYHGSCTWGFAWISPKRYLLFQGVHIDRVQVKLPRCIIC